MLRLPKFDFVKPTSVDETVALLDRHGASAKLIAGGTDLLPNLKHRLYEPEVVIGLSDVAELRGVEVAADGSLVIGAMTTLEQVESDPLVVARAPGLAQAAHAVAGPTQRTMGTLGGNVCLDTRCVFVNQTYFWRKALGFCLKKDGTLCHVVAGGRTCVAAASNDTATMLCALGATLTIRSTNGSRTVAIRDYYKGDGVFNQRLAPSELLTKITVPAPKLGALEARDSGARGPTVASPSDSTSGERTWSGYAKLRPRATIDFPKLSIAVVFTTRSSASAAGSNGGGEVGNVGDSRDRRDETMVDATVVVSAIAATPRVIGGVAELAHGKRCDDPATIAAIGERARKVTHPLTNLDGDTEYRRDMIPVFVKRAFAHARAAASALHDGQAG